MKKRRRISPRRIVMHVGVILLLSVVAEMLSLGQPAASGTVVLQEVAVGGIAFQSVAADGFRDDHLLLVNAAHPYAAEETGFRLAAALGRVPLHSAGIQLEEKTLEQVERLLDAAKAAGHTSIIITSGYRTAEEQTQLLARSQDSRLVAQPGESEHETGLAVDLQVLRTGLNPFASMRERDWLLSNAADYGFILRYPRGKEEITGVPYEHWHFRYVGLPHARIITGSGLCLEEYIEALTPGTFYRAGVAERTYLIYRVLPSNGSIPVPGNLPFEVSRDGTGHYIVTVELDDSTIDGGD
jgi:D-alanyl-D-alanine carboxypeptidase